MEVFYKSTRGQETQIKASMAILNGLAADGGLYVPDRIPELTTDPSSLAQMSYQEIAYEVLSSFLTDFTEEELKYCISNAYDEKFDTEEIVPLVKCEDVYYMELFHGKTIAFKDMALSILPYLMTTAAKKNGIHDKIVILTATSGDTGKAALAGFADVPGTEIIVFYPKDGVSPVQEKQMVTQAGENTHVIAIHGNFDDAQTGVKNIFGNADLKQKLQSNGIRFSSANSINIGRLVPQIAYYVYAYARLMREGELSAGEAFNVTVPTGNFGNILAAYFAKKMGVPIDRLICASNENKVLYDFFSTGTYDKNREFFLTSSPSMDILVSSNLERLLYLMANENAEIVKDWMRSLSESGKYSVSDDFKNKVQDFYGNFASETEVSDVISALFERCGYVIDPHTAVGTAVYGKFKKETGDTKKTVIASTASPYKFARSVLHAIDANRFDPMTDMEQFDALKEQSGVEIPQAIEEIRNAPVRHKLVVEVKNMEASVCEILNVQ